LKVKLSLFSIIVVFAIISVFFVIGCGDDGATNFTGVQGPTGPTGAGYTPAPAPTASANVSTISGIVYGSNGQPLDGAVVRLTPLTVVTGSENYGQIQEDITRNGGLFFFSVSFAGDYRIECLDGSNLLGSQQFNISLGQTLNVNFGNELNFASLTVNITHLNVPVPGATVTLKRITTDTSEISSSAYTFTNLIPDTYLLEVEKKGYYPEIQKVNIQGNTELNIALGRWTPVNDSGTTYGLDSV